MLITRVKPDFQSMLHFFDEQHRFFTKVDIHFSHQDQKLRAILLFPFGEEKFSMDRVEIFYDKEWSQKKGDPHYYGAALSNHDAIALVYKKIRSSERKAKTLLENRFRSLVSKIAVKLKQEIQPMYPVEYKIANDYLSIATKVKVDNEEIEGRIETNNYFPNSAKDDQLVAELVEEYKKTLLENMENYKFKSSKGPKQQNVYIATIPIKHPCDEIILHKEIYYVSVHSEGYCHECNEKVIDTIASSIKINPNRLNESRSDLIVKVVGETLICAQCSSVVPKEKLVIKNNHDHSVIGEFEIGKLDVLGNMANQDEMHTKLNAAIEHDLYFKKYEEQFWAAFSYIALQQWDAFIKELTRIELARALSLYLPSQVESASNEQLLVKVRDLSLTEEQKELFWKTANEQVVNYYLLITVFGWNIDRETKIIGRNRAEFILRYLPIPTELQQVHRQKISSLLINETEVKKLQQTVHTQQEQVRSIRQENGRLTHKLGQTYEKISELEQQKVSISNESRHKDDIVKIQHLKGLIEELKGELDRLSTVTEHEKIPEEIILTVEDKPEQKEVPTAEVLKGKTILILGGYRNKQVEPEIEYTVITHDTRNLDPEFFTLLNKANIIVILTRYISHRAMWEAKEHAILEQKPIYYTTFSNIPTILVQIAKERRG
ncbi:hypothetical protein BTR23_22120 [Alkalihalophilus pseudofirmus]|nr:hypothetical protein BTR23_22120 [Alkalihalophilus pseudofirmus]